ncbi:hypothetical protein DEO72_LG4g2557 [Vigna unguiculata]|uniref:Uncharacterized protein n=1 Tax=Vigna unguiculata TaxID=3917 RepID=A0A4D6LSW2_VIGUN|nr:hypothetical protein DEO72_LG4g2557 [Vigna unguiculata]
MGLRWRWGLGAKTNTLFPLTSLSRFFLPQIVRGWHALFISRVLDAVCGLADKSDSRHIGHATKISAFHKKVIQFANKSFTGLKEKDSRRMQKQGSKVKWYEYVEVQSGKRIKIGSRRKLNRDHCIPS